MKRVVLVLFTLFTLSCAQAQDSYFGFRVDVVVAPDLVDIAGVPKVSAVVPLPALQLGFSIFDNVELRGSFLTLLIVNFLQVDVLYTHHLSDTFRAYGGVGGDLGGIAFIEGGGVVGVHATAGLEFQLGSGIGLFGEVQPLYILQSPDYLLSGEPNSGLGFFGKLNAGINFHF